MMALLPETVRPVADVLHDSVRKIREGAAAQEVDLSDLTDLEVYAIMRWCLEYTPANLDVTKTMLGMIGMMSERN